jgi:hypothetical protein
MVIDEIAALWAIANIGTRFDRLRILPIANDREAACKPAKSGAPCWLRKHMRRQGLDGGSTIDPLTGRPSYAAVLPSQLQLHNPA